eukprot:6200249-Pleurochrysis_carterae.AAC.3
MCTEASESTYTAGACKRARACLCVCVRTRATACMQASLAASPRECPCVWVHPRGPASERIPTLAIAYACERMRVACAWLKRAACATARASKPSSLCTSPSTHERRGARARDGHRDSPQRHARNHRPARTFVFRAPSAEECRKCCVQYVPCAPTDAPSRARTRALTLAAREPAALAQSGAASLQALRDASNRSAPELWRHEPALLQTPRMAFTPPSHVAVS